MGEPGTDVRRSEYCVIACAEAWRDAGEILASPMGFIPSVGARLARLTFAPDLLLTDGEATIVRPDGTPEGWLPYRQHLTLVAGGRRHVMMGASQIDRFGNQNISCVGDWARPKRQLLGVRGAPINTLNNPTSYWIPRHSARVFVEKVDMVCGVGYDRVAEHPGTARFHRIPGRCRTSVCSTSRPRPLDAAGLAASGRHGGAGAGGDGVRADRAGRGSVDAGADPGGAAADP